METLTIREAAERCEVSHQLMRKRVDRGTLRTVKRDGVRLIPRSELERAGLWPGTQPALAHEDANRLRAELAEAQRELSTLRALPQQVDAERQAREIAEHALHEQRAKALAAEAARAEAAATLEQLAGGGLIAGVRTLMTLRRGTPETPAAEITEPTAAAA